MNHRGVKDEDLLRTGQSRVFVLRRGGPGRVKASMVVEYESGRVVRLSLGIPAVADTKDDVCITETEVCTPPVFVCPWGPLA